MKILIVDDDLVDREHIKRTLMKSDSQCDFTEVESVDDALLCFQQERFDIVLLDYRMPQRDGIEMLLELRNTRVRHNAAIVMLSNSEDEELAMECMRAGAQDFLPKNEITALRLRRSILHAQTRFELEQKLYQSYLNAKNLAEHDSLTGLANRFLFEETLKVSITNTQRDNLKLALLLFDLDHFKYINDHHGHDVGDLLLKAVVKRFQKYLRGQELFARLGGDEFALVLSNLKTAQDASAVATRFLRSLSRPFILSGIEVTMSASIGIAVHPDNSADSDELMKFADIAMYRAKHQGRNQIVFFEEQMQKDFRHRYRLERELKTALEKQQFVLYYQPVMDPVNECLLGFEALIRWQPEDGEIVMPEDFIDVAESTGQIVEIGRWVIDQALAQLHSWMELTGAPLQMSINLSSKQFNDPCLLEHIDSCLAQHQVPAENVDFEITETAFIDSAEKHAGLLAEIKSLGCRVSLDDFGTGFSSVSHLHKFPIDTVKIDKSLMMAPLKGKTLALIRGLSSMVRSLGLDIVAEGIETSEGLELCNELEIERVQGYYFSRPISSEDTTETYLQRKKLVG